MNNADQKQVRELGEIIAYALTAYRKGVPVESIFAVTPSDANGWAAKFILEAIEMHAPAYNGELIRRANDVVEGLEGLNLGGAMPVRVAKLRKALIGTGSA